MRTKLNQFTPIPSPSLKRTRILIMFCYFSFAATFGCKTVNEDVSQKDQLIALMNDRKYDDVITIIDAMPQQEQNIPENILLRAEALSGKAGFDIVTFTKLIKLSMKFDDLQRSLNGILKNNAPDKTSGMSDLSKDQMIMAKGLIGLNNYLRAVELTPELNSTKRPILMESLLNLRKIQQSSELYYRRARTQSMMIHLVIFITSFRKTIKSSYSSDSDEDFFCALDGQSFAVELPWMTEHISGALDDAETVKKIIERENFKPEKISELRKKIDDFRAKHQQTSDPAPSAVSFKTAQSYFCGS